MPTINAASTMKLTELDPHWLSHATDLSFREDAPGVGITDAQGVMFLCPRCFREKGEVGTETVVCWFRNRGVPVGLEPGPARWDVTGTSFVDLTLSPSVNVDNEHWHGFVTNGEIC